MVTLALSSVVMVGLIQLFTANSQTYQMLVGQSRMQESARFALSFMADSVRSAGYRGCNSKRPPVENVAPIPYEFDLYDSTPLRPYAGGIAGFNGSTSSWTPNIHTILPVSPSDGGSDVNVYIATNPADDSVTNYGAGNGIPTDKIVYGTDVLTLRHMSLTEFDVTGSISTGSEDVVATISDPTDLNFEKHHILLINDCNTESIFVATEVTVGATDVTIEHGPGGTTRAGNLTAGFGGSLTGSVKVAAIESHTYYVAPGSGVNNMGWQPLSLWRKSGLDAPVEIVEGVEDLQILFGIDTGGTPLVPTVYLTPDAVTDYKQLVTVRVSVTVNSVDSVGGTSVPTYACDAVINDDDDIQNCLDETVSFDGLIRRTFSQTIRLRNKLKKN